MNESLFTAINNMAGRISWLDEFMVFSAEWLGYFLILLLVVPLLLTLFIRNGRISSWARHALFEWSYYKNMLFVSLGSAVISRFVFTEIIRYFYYHPRPFLIMDVEQLLVHESSSSFPSGHAAFFFALAAGVYLYNKKAGYFYLAMAALIGFARIFVGVHWPSDVLGGAVLGILTAVSVKFFVEKRPRRAR